MDLKERIFKLRSLGIKFSKYFKKDCEKAISNKELKRKKEEIYRELRRNPKNVRFTDLCKAAEIFGFKYRGGKGSHVVYVREGVKEILVFQNVKGKAKPYQVKQFLKSLRSINYLRMGELKYAIEIFYSEEDEGYIAVVPELPGCSAFGETPEEALKEVKIAIELWIEAAKKEGREIPKPMNKELLKEVLEKIKIKVI